MKKSVAIIGSNGQLGNDLCEILRSDCNLIEINRQKLDLEIGTEKIFLKLNELASEATYLINCSAMTNTSLCEKEIQRAYQINAFAVDAFSKFAEQKNIPFIQISTDYVFDGMKGSSYREEDRTNSINIYGKSKELGEILALRYSKTIVLRTSSLFGKNGASGKGGNFIETILKKGQELETVSVVDDQIMVPTHTFDVAKIIKMIIENESFKSGIYHVVNSGKATWYEFTREIFRVAKLNVTIKAVKSSEYPSTFARPVDSSLQNQKIKNELGIDIQCWQEALLEYFERREKNESKS